MLLNRPRRTSSRTSVDVQEHRRPSESPNISAIEVGGPSRRNTSMERHVTIDRGELDATGGSLYETAIEDNPPSRRDRRLSVAPSHINAGTATSETPANNNNNNNNNNQAQTPRQESTSAQTQPTTTTSTSTSNAPTSPTTAPSDGQLHCGPCPPKGCPSADVAICHINSDGNPWRVCPAYGNKSQTASDVPNRVICPAFAEQPGYQTSAVGGGGSQTAMYPTAYPSQPYVIEYYYGPDEFPSNRQEAPANRNSNYVTPSQSSLNGSPPARSSRNAKSSSRTSTWSCPFGNNGQPTDDALQARNVRPLAYNQYTYGTPSEGQLQDNIPPPSLRRAIHYFCHNAPPVRPSNYDKSATASTRNSKSKKAKSRKSKKSRKRTGSCECSSSGEMSYISKLIPLLFPALNNDDEDEDDDDDDIEDDGEVEELDDKTGEWLWPLLECLAENPNELRISSKTDRKRGKRIVRIKCPSNST